MRRQSSDRAQEESPDTPDLFSDFNGLTDLDAKTEFYQHDQNWSNRMILGDSLQVMASLAEREGLRGQVQCIYLDPPYGIKFNSNFQWSTTNRDVRDGKAEHISREPEQVRAFRDTWRDGIHSYLAHLRDRLTAARELLTESGSIFVQIGDENVHRVRAVMDEVFGDTNFVNLVCIKKTGSAPITESMFDYLLWYCRDRGQLKLRKMFRSRKDVAVDPKMNTLLDDALFPFRVTSLDAETVDRMIDAGAEWGRVNYPIVSQDYDVSGNQSNDYAFNGDWKQCGKTRHWTFEYPDGLDRLAKAGRVFDGGGKSLGGIVKHSDRPAQPVSESLGRH